MSFVSRARVCVLYMLLSDISVMINAKFGEILFMVVCFECTIVHTRRYSRNSAGQNEGNTVESKQHATVSVDVI